MSNRESKLPRAPIAACMTCPLCEGLFEEATTISLCLHTFCKKCIHEKFSDEDCDTCPICDVYLGTIPENKLRPDHNLQALREQLFPSKRTGDAPESAQSGTTPPTRKEKSTSSLAISTPKVSEGSNKPEWRSKSGSNKASRGSSSSLNGPLEKDKDKVGDVVNAPSSPESINKTIPKKKLDFKATESSDNQSPNEDVEKPLKSLVEVAKGSDTSKSSSIGKSVTSSTGDNDVTKAELLEKNVVSRDSSHDDRANMPVWFSLVASKDEDKAARLPQLPSRFLRLKNGEMHVTYIQKYIAKKFEIAEEDEVEIKFQNEALLPNTLLCDVVDKWTTSGAPSDFIKTKVGDSSEEYVMPLTYSIKHNNN